MIPQSAQSALQYCLACRISNRGYQLQNTMMTVQTLVVCCASAQSRKRCLTLSSLASIICHTANLHIWRLPPEPHA